MVAAAEFVVFLAGLLARLVDACSTFYDVFLGKISHRPAWLRRTLKLARWSVSAIVLGALGYVLLTTYA